MKKYLKVALIAVSIPIALFFVLAALLYVPPIQNWLVKQVVAYASEETGFDIGVDNVRLAFPLDLSVNGVSVLQPDSLRPEVKDTIAVVGRAVVDVRLLPLIVGNVEVDCLSLSDVGLNTGNLVAAARVKGSLGSLELESHGINLRKSTVWLNDVSLDDAQIDVVLNDSVPEDTTTSENLWRINVDKLGITNTAVTIHMPGDTLQLAAYADAIEAADGCFDLHEGRYSVGSLAWKNGRLGFDNNYEPRVGGLDFNHISLSGVNIALDSIFYDDPRVRLHLRECAFNEASGIGVTAMSGKVELDSMRLDVPDFVVRTTESSIRAEADIDLNSFTSGNAGPLNLFIDAAIGKQDVARFVTGMPEGLMRGWPNYPLTLKASLNGNTRLANIDGMVVNLPTAFSMSGKGTLRNITDTERLGADVSLNARTYDLGFVTKAFVGDSIHIPNGVTLDGRLNADGSKYGVALTVAEPNADGGRMKLDASMDISDMSYMAKADIGALNVGHFVSGIDLSPFSGDVNIVGKGFDFQSPATHVDVGAEVREFTYSGCDLAETNLMASLHNGKAHATFDSHNSLVDGRVELNAALDRKGVQAGMLCDLVRVDLQKLNVFDVPVDAALNVDVEFASDFVRSHSINGSVRNIAVRDSARTYTPEDVVVRGFTRSDSTLAVVRSGDFSMAMSASGGYEKLIVDAQGLMNEVGQQLQKRYIDQIRLREFFPNLKFHFYAGRDNFFSRTLNRFGYDLRSAHVDLNTSSFDGINGDVAIDSLVVSGIRLDTIRLALNSDSVRTDFNGQVRNGPDNPQYVFNTLFRGAFYERGIYFGMRIYDAAERIGVSFGLDAGMADNGIRIRMGSRGTPILGYKAFHVNDDNYIFFGDDRTISANLKLLADDGMGVRVFTNDSTEALQDMTVALAKFDLAKVLSVIPYVPNMAGMLNGDFHIVRSDAETVVSSSLSIDGFEYEGSRIGDVSTDFAYMPLEDGGHYVDGFLVCDDVEIASLNGTYRSDGDGTLDAEMTLNRTPLRLLNGFIPDRMFALRGYAGGSLSLKGAPSSPIVNGELQLDSAYLASAPYGVRLRFDDAPATITDSHLVFDKFKMFAQNDSPLTLNGYFDFSDLNNMYLDMNVQAMNYLLINSKQNPRSEAYGKAYVNFFAMLKGSLESMRVRGRLDVLGSTDMTYVLRDSPLTTDNQLNELVQFVNFNDSTEDVVSRPPLTGMDMDMTINIDEGAHIMCALNASNSNYVDLIGGGNLRMQYNVMDNLRLTGRYTLSNGEMKYSLPVIPLKTFVIQDGSYIEFTGDPMNPRLNITATEQNKCSVSTDGGAGRSVLFNCGVVITKTLNDMGLQFIIDAPEDLTIHNQLQTMSEESRGKLAVTMLTTGMYLADGNTNAFSMNSALSAFLNSQISSISGNALRTLDLSFDMDNTTLGSGQVQTDYSFKFAKRFWNNRLNIVIGGKVSTGAEVENQNNTFFDNVTFEYRLSQNSNKYLKLFYERDSYDWLEGYVGRYGGGFMWRRKLQRLSDIFRFKSSERKPVPEQSDSLTVKQNENKE